VSESWCVQLGQQLEEEKDFGQEDEEVLMAVRKTAKGASLRKWFGQNKGKGWVDCKTGKPCGRSGSKDKRKAILLAVQQRRSVKLRGQRLR
jgi:hypothetical protein